MIVDVRHLGRKNAYGTVVGGKYVCEKSHVTANGGLSFHHVDVYSAICKVQSPLNPSDATSDDENVPAYRDGLRLKRVEQHGLGH